MSKFRWHEPGSWHQGYQTGSNIVSRQFRDRLTDQSIAREGAHGIHWRAACILTSGENSALLMLPITNPVSCANRDKKPDVVIFLVALLTLALNFTAAAGAPAVTLMAVDPPAPGQALARYLADCMKGDPWSEPNAVLMEIDASLPRLAERGHLQAIRDWAEPQTPDYQVIHIEGDATVKQQVIARYLTAEKQAAALPASSVTITPANYKFRYVATSGGTPVYTFHITPRKKRPGLIEGELWIDGATGLAVHEAGYLVKRPSIFVRRVKITRDISLRDGVPYLRTTHLDIDVRFAGRAELTAVEVPCAHPPSTIVAAEESRNNECSQ